MSVTRADLLARLRNPAKAEAATQTTILLTGAACADMREAADEIEKLKKNLDGRDDFIGERGLWDDFLACLKARDVQQSSSGSAGVKGA